MPKKDLYRWMGLGAVGLSLTIFLIFIGAAHSATQRYLIGTLALIYVAAGYAYVYFLVAGPPSPVALRDCLTTFVQVAKMEAPGAVLRYSLWVPSGKDMLRRITNLLPDDELGKGDRVSARTGMLGRCYQKQKKMLVLLDPDDIKGAKEYIEAMCERFFYTQEEASKLDLTMYGFLTLPITRNGDVVGLVHFETNDAYLFTDPKIVETAEALVPFLEFALIHT